MAATNDIEAKLRILDLRIVDLQKSTNLLANALNAVSDQNTEDLVLKTANAIRKLGRSEKDHEGVQYAFWESLFLVIKRVPHAHPGQEMLARVVKELDDSPEVFGADQPLKWSLLPMFHEAFIEIWNRPMFQDEPRDKTSSAYRESLDQWINLTSFIARLVSKKVGPGIHYAVYELRETLEVEHAAGPDLDAAVSCVSQWMIQASKEIMPTSLREWDVYQSQAMRAGRLFSGPSGFSLERRGFWERRLWGLRDKVSTEAAKWIDDGVKAMVEQEIAVIRWLDDIPESDVDES